MEALSQMSYRPSKLVGPRQPRSRPPCSPRSLAEAIDQIAESIAPASTLLETSPINFLWTCPFFMMTIVGID